MFIWFSLLFIVKAFFSLLVLALFIGAIRLFIFGSTKKYTECVSDISQLKKGDIILTGKQSVLYSIPIQISNVLARKLKHRFWTHAAIYRGNGQLWEAQMKGIIERNINDYIKGRFMIRAFRHKYITDENILDKVLEFCEKQKGCKYGKLGLLFYVVSTFMPISFNFLLDNYLVNKICHLDNAYFCSELIVDAFKSIGYPISPFDGWRVKPSDFISNPLLMPIKAIENK